MRKKKPVLLNGEALMVDGKVLEFDAVDQEELDGKIDAPQTAQVGEVLTVEEVDEDGKPTKWKTAPAAAEQKQADWNQNDEMAADYVKNRPFYNEEIPYTIIAQATVPAASGRVLFGNINETYAKALNDSLFKNNVNVIVVNGVKIAAQYTGSTSWYQYYDTAIFKGGDIDECRVSKQKNVIQLTMNDASNVTFEVGTEYTITFMNTNQSSYTYHRIGADYVPIGSGLNVNNGKIVSTVGQKYLEGMSEDAGDVFNNISDNIASGKYSHAEGYAVTASGDWGSHAEGYRTIASNRSAHAEGNESTASGENSHAEGNGSTASGGNSHAEGYETVARYIDSHAEGRYTITSCYQQHVQGRSNIEDTKGVLAHIVGNGTSDKERSNAHTLDWNGNAWFAGDVYVGSASGTNKDEGSKKLLDTSDLLAFGEDVKDATIPKPTTAQVGQIVKVKAVDADGKITETETVDIPTQKTLKWVTVHSSDLTETKRELIISTDTDGKSIADYNPVGLSLVFSTLADSTEESNNGSPWVYPSATKMDNAIRAIGTVAGWKTIARDNIFVFNGGSSAMSCTGNVNAAFATYKIDGYVLDGVRIFFNNANDHLPIGTHVEVAILCEVEE